jgi:hypothetical protein
VIRDYFLIVTRVIGSWFLFVFGIRSLHPKLYYSSIYLFSKQTFRLPQSAKSDILIVFKSYYNTVKRIFSGQPKIKRLNSGEVAVMDTSFNGEDLRLNYLNFFNVRPDLYLSREDLGGSMGLGHKVVSFLLATKLFGFFWLGSFSRNRAAYAMLIREAPEWLTLLNVLKRERITKFYMFCIYEKDSNVLAHFLMKRGITVSKITSEVPLTFANKIILTNELILCFDYQKEEVEAYKKTMFFDTMQTWFPEAQGKYFELYANKSFNVPLNSIGFYSSAFWLRKKLNHSQADVGSYDTEEEVLKYLSEYTDRNKSIRLVIFPHPYEKKSEEVFKDTLSYYKSVLSPAIMDRVEVSGRDVHSTLCFNKVNIGVSVFSTIMFERINLGFKTILTPIDKVDFPLQGSPFRNICAYSKDELFDKLKKNLSLSKEEFFKINEIENYINPKAGLSYTLN